MSSPQNPSSTLSARFGHSALFHNHNIYLFGGLQKSDTHSNSLVLINDLIQLNTFTLEFTNLTKSHDNNNNNSQNIPSARSFHTLVSKQNSQKLNHVNNNSNDDEMILFGGKSNNDSMLHDVWTFSSSSWKEITCKNSQLISPRCGHVSVVYGESMFVFGGFVKNNDIIHASNEMFELNLKTFEWKSISLKLSNANDHPHGVSGRCYHAGVLDEETGDWYIIGGISTRNVLTKDFIKIKLSTLSPRMTSDMTLNDPTSNLVVEYERIDSSDENVHRFGHSCILETSNHRNNKKIYMIGGCNHQVHFSDCYSLELNEKTWKKVSQKDHHVLATSSSLFKELNEAAANDDTRFEAFPVFHTTTGFEENGIFSYFVFGGTNQISDIHFCMSETTEETSNLSVNATPQNKDKYLAHKEFNYKQFDSMFNDDIYRHILSYLKCVDLMRLQLVNKKLRICQLTEEDQFWKVNYMKQISDLKDKAFKYHHHSTRKSALHSIKFDDLLKRTSNYKQGLVQLFKEFESKAEKNSKKLTSEWIEKVKWNDEFNKSFYTLEEILQYPKHGVHNTLGSQPSSSSIKLVIVGDGSTGKTSLLITHVTKQFPTEYIPTVLDAYSYSSPFIPNISIGLWDTQCPDEYCRTLRPLNYPGTDLFFVTFSIACKNSLFSISDKWVPEVRHHCPQTPILLIGTKSDLRMDVMFVKSLLMEHEEMPITVKQGELMAQRTGCIGYIETSSKTGEGLELLDELIIKAICIAKDSTYKSNNKKKKKKCLFQ
ncbi:hypothetical protein C9374_009358 [Naegleria lovaniensis]|uniref:F-box domain-containing protein n=1 Tax=Naegleria lovaniensis TaxID=51637 RepID=A0AA88GHF5_NAELO|nr:uncharacterized protein C9374_009358 [Naegleria lovaniensis]KAG2377447.1 hypothetical protein C9374_009358 [Naegleria lovaniensis]